MKPIKTIALALIVNRFDGYGGDWTVDSHEPAPPVCRLGNFVVKALIQTITPQHPKPIFAHPNHPATCQP